MGMQVTYILTFLLHETVNSFIQVQKRKVAVLCILQVRKEVEIAGTGYSLFLEPLRLKYEAFTDFYQPIRYIS